MRMSKSRSLRDPMKTPGGADRIRTDDIQLAKLALSQLSYSPFSDAGPPAGVGLGRFELPTSRLSGVRSNQLSYRPKERPRRDQPILHSPNGAGLHDSEAFKEPRRAEAGPRLRSLKTSSEPTSNCGPIFRFTSAVLPLSTDPGVPAGGKRVDLGGPESTRRPLQRLLRKEVIQPQVPLRLPCYDFTPVTGHSLGRCLPEGLAHGLLEQPTPMV